MKAKIDRGLRADLQPVDDFAGTELKMSLYEMNQNFMASQTPLSAEEIKELVESVIKNYTNNYLETNIEDKHFMLLCKDINYYTIFEYDKNEKYWNVVNTFIECIKNVGEILSIEINKENDTPEIWVRTPEGENICMYYFNCENLVATFGG